MDGVPSAFMFMKVGEHAGEPFEDILRRKRLEYETTGMTFWGYGGPTCHPLRHVQPFARLHAKREGGIYLLMEPIESNADPELQPAMEYSTDGINWQPIPEGINVLGSRYACILGEIQEGDLDVLLGGYSVAVGPSRGKPAAQYLRGHVDKGCFEAPAIQIAGDEDGKPRRIKYFARLAEPYAVLLR